MKFISNNLSSLRRYDWFLVAVVFVLISIGFAAIYSIDLSRGEDLIYFPTQLIALGIGSAVLLIAARVHMSFYQASAKFAYIVSAALLVGVLIFGVTIRGTTGWFRVAGFSFQPAELSKVALILAMGFLMYRQGRRFDKLQFVVLSGIITFVLAGLIMMQPDLGSALVLGGIWFGLLLIGGAKKRYLLFLISAVLFMFVIGWFFLFQDYQKDRLATFLNPEADPLGAGYNVTQSIIAIGAGQFFGRGLGFGSQSQLHFLPEAQTDFIFSVIAEELGFVGAVTVLILYMLLLWRLMLIARNSRNDFGTYTVMGIIMLFVVQVVFNIGAATGLLPVTGLTLPFVSYGGSSLIINLFLIGIAESIARSNQERQEESVIFG